MASTDIEQWVGDQPAAETDLWVTAADLGLTDQQFDAEARAWLRSGGLRTATVVDYRRESEGAAQLIDRVKLLRVRIYS
jgi:hypothetical protein